MPVIGPTRRLLLGGLTALFLAGFPLAAEPVVLLDLPESGTDPAGIDYGKLPRIAGKHIIVRQAIPASRFADRQQRDLHHLKFQLHNYLARHDGRFWCIWSEGPPIEDEPTQEVRYATSVDGASWTQSQSVTGVPEAPRAFIARGLWRRDGQLLALAAYFNGKGAFGADKDLKLRAYAWDRQSDTWRLEAKIYDNAINNFPPQRLPSGDWILTRRDARFNVSVLIGGRKSLDDWDAFPVVGIGEVQGFRPDEPVFWPLADGKTLFALYRDNGGSRRLFHSTSNDLGRSWGRPVITNFPNATSKLYSLQTSRGYRVLISNANPGLNRRQLHLSVSRDGRTFTRMAVLDVPSPPPAEELSRIQHKFRTGVASLQYPHAIEHEGKLLIALSRNKKQIELMHVPLDSIDALLED